MGKNRSRASKPQAAAPKPSNGDDLFVPKATAAQVATEEPAPMVEELKVNAKFAQAFLERKRKEELTQLNRRNTGNVSEYDSEESDSETEDEDGEQLTADLDADIQKTLRLIRKRDPAIYNPSIAFFQKEDGDEDENEDEEGVSKKKKKQPKEKKDAPLYYKDLVRQQVIAGDVDSDEEERDQRKPVLSYPEEQAQIKKAFVDSIKAAEAENDDEDGDEDDEDSAGGLFTIRKKTADETQQEDEEFESFTSKYGTSMPSHKDVDPDEFLNYYLSSEGWKDKTRAAIPHYDDIVAEDEEDAEELDKADEFEHQYNFRFEENGGGQIQTHARQIGDSMRREDNIRKHKREERKERKALERQKKEEELRHLKNLKQAEIQSKLERIAKLMGVEGGVDATDLEGDFDPDAYDKRMQQIFDEEYYEQDDEGMMEKPTWDDEEDKALFAGLPADPDEEEETAEANVEEEPVEEEEVEEREDEDMGEEADEADEDEQEDEDEELPANMTKEQLKAATAKYLDELYSLDYEDLIGDLRCRFKYRQVQSNTFGLSVDEIMAADDKELKSLVSLKRLAPYQENEYEVDRKRLKNFKKTLRETTLAKQKKKAEEETAPVQDGEDATKDVVTKTEAESSQPTKKRKRAKKSNTTATAPQEEPSEPMETAEADDSKPEQESKAENSKKQKRRSKKKKGGEKNAYAATGLSTSRLDSYKLTKK